MSHAPPTVTGTFSKTPLLHVLVSLLEKASSGTLVLESTTGVRSALSLEHGVPVKMRLGDPQGRLGEVLVELGYISRDDSANTYEQAVAQSQLHGETLVKAGALDPQHLPLALRSQLVKKLQIASDMPKDTIFGFYEGSDYLSKWRSGPVPVSPLVVAWTLARTRADTSAVATMTNRISGHPLRLHHQAQPHSLGFDRTELALLDVLRAKPQTLEALNQLGLVSPHLLERMVYVLTLTRHLDFGRALSPLGIGSVPEAAEQLLVARASLRPSRPVVLSVQTQTTPSEGTAAHPAAAREAAASPVVPPVQAKPKQEPTAPKVEKDAVLRERRHQLEAAVVALPTQDHYDVLGVAKDAPTVAIQEAFLRLAKLYHPDRLPEGLADLKGQASRVFAKVTEAHQTLSDPVRRKAYLAAAKTPDASDEDEKVRRVLRAAGAFQKAEVLFKKRMLAAAELEANRALEDDPEQPDYLALYAWIQSGKSDSEARLPELLKMISDAVIRNPVSEKNRYYRVQLLKRLGKVDEAVADCRIIVEKNPHHVDALREIRLWEMRRANTKAASTTRPAANSKVSSTHSRSSAPPSNSPAAARRSNPPPAAPQGGILGRLFKR